MGRAYLATGDPEHLPLAIEALEMATIEEPEWAFVKHQLGIGYGKAGRFAEADLTLAEEALLKRNTELATQLAKRVSANPDATPVQKQLAADIIAQAGS
jgi:predicted Zn-dependent protease